MRIIKLEDKDYPENLKIIENPPKQLYVLGNMELLKNKCIRNSWVKTMFLLWRKNGITICRRIIK